MTAANNMPQQKVQLDWQSSEGTCKGTQGKAVLGILTEIIISECHLL